MQIIKDLKILKALEKRYINLMIDKKYKYITSDIIKLEDEILRKHNDFIMILNNKKYTYKFISGCFNPYIVELK
jgi:hypothetical protein